MKAPIPTPKPPIRLMIIEDEELSRDLLRTALTSRPGLHVVVVANFGGAERAIQGTA